MNGCGNRKGTHLDFKEELKEDLMEHYANSAGRSLSDIAGRIINSEAKRFYVFKFI